MKNRIHNYPKNKQKPGFSLMELLIAMAIMVLASLGITLMAQMGYQYYNFVFNQAEILGNIQKSINMMSKEIREMRQADSGAFNIAEANSNELIFYSDIDETPDVERIRYFINGTCLKKGIIKPTGVPLRYLDENEEVSDISCNVTNSPSEPIFSYYSGYPSGGTLLAIPADPHLVKVINLYLRINSTGLQPVPISKTISEYIAPRNINREQDH